MTNPSCIRRAIIPAAGKGTRLLPLTKAVPKELIPLGKRPVLEHVVEECIACGIEEIVFVISSEKEAIRRHFGDSDGKIRFLYAYQHQPLGLAQAIGCARDFATDEPFAVVLGDSVIASASSLLPFRRVIDTFERTHADAVVLVQPTPREQLSRYGVVKPKDTTSSSFEIEDIVEKPLPHEAPSIYAVAGRYVFKPFIFDYIDRTPRGAKGEYQLSDSIRLMIEDGARVWCVALDNNEVRRDIGTFETYFEALAFELAKEKVPQ
ncbi:MAG: sugar phosphate nucleotidyltransferase [Armatimonadota bacterium]|nr:sugar phosphate nucleotidyltransferase [Armatimonadota bacterium]